MPSIMSGCELTLAVPQRFGSDYIKLEVTAGPLTHYYLARRGYNNIYMATYFTEEWVQKRGHVTGKASGIPGGFPGVMGFANSKAQYWCSVVNGNFSSPWMIPGDYAMTLYKSELAVATDSVTVPQSTVAVTRNIASAEVLPLFRWRIGEWDGTPAGFLNADKICAMHPSDVRMAAWGPVTYTVGSSPTGSFPAYQWKAVNNPTTIKFNLSASQVMAHTLRIGLTCAYAGGRPVVSVNGKWTSPIPAPSVQPSSRTLTVGTYRGNNVVYTYSIPASALAAGVNTLTLTVVKRVGRRRLPQRGLFL